MKSETKYNLKDKVYIKWYGVVRLCEVKKVITKTSPYGKTVRYAVAHDLLGRVKEHILTADKIFDNFKDADI